MKRTIKIFSALAGIVVLSVIGSNAWIILKTRASLYADLERIDNRKLALVLGTSKYRVGGGINPYFKNRIVAAAELYHSGKVRHLLVSGDHSTAYYNEPKTMMEELVDLGIPEEHITLDHSGLRTLDSIVRCKEVFGQTDFIIVTQEFHNYRALYISQYYNLGAIGYIADGVGTEGSTTVILREFLARPLALLDLHFLGTSPKYLGEKEELKI